MATEINRCVLIVKPKQPFLDWLHSWDEDRYTLDDVREESTAYLIPEYQMLDERMEILADLHQWIFAEELFSWHTDESVWPEIGDLEMFLEWFDVEFHSMVYDLADNLPLEHVTYGPNEEEISSNGH
jgi:hypothetical protein